MELQGEDSSVEDGFMRLPAASERDAGTYTCLVDISLDGRKFTSGRSIRLNITKGMYCSFIRPNPKPGIIFCCDDFTFNSPYFTLSEAFYVNQ